MRIDQSHPALPPSTGALQGEPGPDRARTPQEAARQFEEVLVREFVRNMTKDLFSGSLAGENGAGWVKAQGEAQSDALTDVLTKHLVDSGTLGISDMLMHKFSGGDSRATLEEMQKAFGLEGRGPLSLESFMKLNPEDLP